MTPPKQVVAPLSSEQRDELRTLLEAATFGDVRAKEALSRTEVAEAYGSDDPEPFWWVEGFGWIGDDEVNYFSEPNAKLFVAGIEALPSLLQASEERDALLVKVEAIRDICNREIELEKRGSVYARVAKEILALDNPQEVTPDA